MRESCRDCGGRMIWALREDDGKTLPLDPEPHANGNLVLVALNPGEVMHVRYRQRDEDTGIAPRYFMHTRVCPDAPPRQPEGERRGDQAQLPKWVAGAHGDQAIDAWGGGRPQQDRRGGKGKGGKGGKGSRRGGRRR